MASEPEDKQSFPYRNPAARHGEIKATSAKLGMSMQDFIDDAVDAYMATLAKGPPKPKALRDMLAGVEDVYARAEANPADRIAGLALNVIVNAIKAVRE